MQISYISGIQLTQKPPSSRTQCLALLSTITIFYISVFPTMEPSSQKYKHVGVFLYISLIILTYEYIIMISILSLAPLMASWIRLWEMPPRNTTQTAKERTPRFVESIFFLKLIA